MTRVEDILTVLRLEGPGTVADIAKRLGDRPERVNTKMPQLLRQGVVREVGRSPCKLAFGAATYAMWDWQGPWQVFPGLNTPIIRVKESAPRYTIKPKIRASLEAGPQTVRDIASEVYGISAERVPISRCNNLRRLLHQMEERGEVRMTVPDAGSRPALWELVA